MATGQATKLDELRDKHEQGLEVNRDLGVIPWKNGEKLSDKVYEVQDGYITLPGAGRFGPGTRFNPTERQVRANSFRGKAKELTGSQYRTVHRDERKARAPGADIGIRALPMAEGTMKFALEAGLVEADFEGLEPAFNDQFTRAQVEEIIERKKAAG